MRSLNKKAMGETVSTFVLIVVAVGAAGLTFYSLNELFTLDLQSSPALSCTQLELSKPIILRNVCLNEQGEIEVLLQRSTDDINIGSITFATEEKTWTCSETCSDCNVLEKGRSKIYYLSPEQDTSKLELYVGTCLIGERTIQPC